MRLRPHAPARCAPQFCRHRPGPTLKPLTSSTRYNWLEYMHTHLMVVIHLFLWVSRCLPRDSSDRASATLPEPRSGAPDDVVALRAEERARRVTE